LIAAKMPGRTDNDIKNHWNTRLKKKLCDMGIDPVTHKPIAELLRDLAGTISQLSSTPGCTNVDQLAELQAAKRCFSDNLLSKAVHECRSSAKPAAAAAMSTLSPLSDVTTVNNKAEEYAAAAAAGDHHGFKIAAAAAAASRLDHQHIQEHSNNSYSGSISMAESSCSEEAFSRSGCSSHHEQQPGSAAPSHVTMMQNTSLEQRRRRRTTRGGLQTDREPCGQVMYCNMSSSSAAAAAALRTDSAGAETYDPGQICTALTALDDDVNPILGMNQLDSIMSSSTIHGMTNFPSSLKNSNHEIENMLMRELLSSDGKVHSQLQYPAHGTRMSVPGQQFQGVSEAVATRTISPAPRLVNAAAAVQSTNDDNYMSRSWLALRNHGKFSQQHEQGYVLNNMDDDDDDLPCFTPSSRFSTHDQLDIVQDPAAATQQLNKFVQDPATTHLVQTHGMTGQAHHQMHDSEKLRVHGMMGQAAHQMQDSEKFRVHGMMGEAQWHDSENFRSQEAESASADVVRVPHEHVSLQDPIRNSGGAALQQIATESGVMQGSSMSSLSFSGLLTSHHHHHHNNNNNNNNCASQLNVQSGYANAFSLNPSNFSSMGPGAGLSNFANNFSGPSSLTHNFSGNFGNFGTPAGVKFQDYGDVSSPRMVQLWDYQG